ncbi:hypothetical protein BDR07DRAFT_160809 [Suillus spraguei]|nr:hypothetical protein BDR07DRAFT_160809 [Suillus spraguei]
MSAGSANVACLKMYFRWTGSAHHSAHKNNISQTMRLSFILVVAAAFSLTAAMPTGSYCPATDIIACAILLAVTLKQ